MPPQKAPLLTGAAALPWLGVAFVVQLTCGLSVVCTRWMQTVPRPPAKTMQLALLLNVLAMPALLVCHTLPVKLIAGVRAALARRRAAADPEVPGGPSKSAALPEDADGPLDEPPSPTAADGAPSWQQRARAFLVRQAAAAGMASVIALSLLAQLYATRFASAYLVQLVVMLTPLLTALVQVVAFKQARPRGLLLCLAASLAGCGLIVAGELRSAGPGAAAVALGLGLAVVRMLLLVVYMVLVQASRHFLTGESIVMANRYTALALFLPLSFVVDGTDYTWLVNLTAAGWAVMLFSVLVVTVLSVLWMTWCTQKLGATLTSLFMPLRLVASIAGSAVLLNDAPETAMTWCGLALVLVALSAFLGYQAWLHRGAAAALPPAPAGDAEQGAQQPPTRAPRALTSVLSCVGMDEADFTVSLFQVEQLRAQLPYDRLAAMRATRSDLSAHRMLRAISGGRRNVRRCTTMA